MRDDFDPRSARAWLLCSAWILSAIEKQLSLLRGSYSPMLFVSQTQKKIRAMDVCGGFFLSGFMTDICSALIRA